MAHVDRRHQRPVIGLLADCPGLLGPVAGWLQQEWFAPAGHPATAAVEALEQRLHRDCAPFALVATSGNVAVGTASVVVAAHPFEPGEALYLSSVFVEPRSRHRGVGRQLCKTAAARAFSLGAESVFLLTADRGRFYERLGWAHCGERVMSVGSTLAFVRLMTLRCQARCEPSVKGLAVPGPTDVDQALADSAVRLRRGELEPDEAPSTPRESVAGRDTYQLHGALRLHLK